MDKASPKISLPEGIILFLVAIGADLFELLNGLFGLVPVVGLIFLFLNSFVALIAGIVINGYLLVKGIKGVWSLAGGVFELFPILNILPIKTITLLVTFFLISRPEAQTIVKVAGTARKTPF
ncbi:MAG: hypothetical protein M1586_02585 [Patescibacteria group bacterium]|nr:hypothetical protein [Patescibacteria group bacterium]MCL5262159.1 hypothetical protein [Patescibacteria group bacterium]